jgi:hypothetical protein
MQQATAEPTRLELIEETTIVGGAVAHQQAGAVALPENSPAGMMLAAMSKGASLEQVEKMMDLQERWERREAEKAFVSAMAEFKAMPLVILKRKKVGFETKEGDFVGYSHAELSDITDVVGPAMAAHGLSYRWDIVQEGGRVKVRCIVTHRLGHSESVQMDGAPDASGKKNAIQQSASTVTYLQRYTLLAATGMSTKGMDDDGKGAADDPEADAQAALLQGFQDAALLGDAALRKHYAANVPTDEFWSKHNRALKDAARKADADAARGGRA